MATEGMPRWQGEVDTRAPRYRDLSRGQKLVTIVLWVAVGMTGAVGATAAAGGLVGLFLRTMHWVVTVGGGCR